MAGIAAWCLWRTLCAGLSTTWRPDDKAEGFVGWLLGFTERNGSSDIAATVTSAVRCIHLSPSSGTSADVRVEAADLRRTFPTGLEIVGAFFLAPQLGIKNDEIDAAYGKLAEGSLQLAAEIRAAEAGQKLAYPDDSGLVTLAVSADGSASRAFYSLGTFKGVGEVESVEVVPGGVPIMAEELWSKFVLLRCQLDIRLPLYLNGQDPSTADLEKSVASAISSVEKDLGSSDATFIITPPPAQGSAEGPFLVQPGTTPAAPLASPSPRASQGMPPLESEDGEQESISPVAGRPLLLCSDLNRECSRISSEGGCMIPVPATVDFLLRSGKGIRKPLAPVLIYQPAFEPVHIRHLFLHSDVLLVAPRGDTMESAVRSLLLPALSHQLKGMGRMAAQHPVGVDVKLSAFHFAPPGYAHPITAIYPITYGEAEKQSVEVRSCLHRRLNLPMDRPMMRVAHALTWKEEMMTGTSGGKVVGGRVSAVEGSYEYYHYLQDKMDDKGWGCAYRSLQTIFSWFLLSGYTVNPPPSLRAIQSALVEMGDKQTAFVGSTQWIGAIELGYVLDHMLGVSCKILTVQSGADMPSKGRELARHFESQGTPVMIGGGVLAYTLLGVDFNERTGECAFLILDPHYTGGEDLKSIVGGGWVGWKKAVTEAGHYFFVRNAFYNLMLPQRPATV